MPLLTIVLTLIVVGVLLWLINTYGKNFIDGKILQIINIVVVIAVFVWLLKAFGIWAYLSKVSV